MSNAAIRRMYADIKQFQASDLEKEGIFCSFNENDMFDVKALIVGPKDTPYEDGFYFFRLRFPKDYPFAPPKAIFETRCNTGDIKLRFNPNLYANGKVCVSLLGTWSGPQWEPCQSLYSILLAFQTLLTDQPLTNEPGYSKVTPSQAYKHKKYTQMVAFENYRVAILQMLDHPPDGFEAFIPIMQQWTHHRYTAISARLAKAVDAVPEAHVLKCSVYSKFATFVDYPCICAKFAQVRNQLDASIEASRIKGKGGESVTCVSESVSTSDLVDVAPTASPALNATISTAVPSSTSSVGAEVEAAVTAFAQASLTVTNKDTTKSKRKRPDIKACTRQYDIIEVTQSDGCSVAYQSVPSEYTRRGQNGESPTKRTRWLWRRLNEKHPMVPKPTATAVGQTVVL